MKPFFFAGEISASKSILNRLLVIQSFSSQLEVSGSSRCDDVVRMRAALPALLRGEPANCGAAGTTFRFLALRASRLAGKYLLIGSEKLLARPQGALIEMIERLGASATLTREGLIIEGEGWRKPASPLRVDRSQSSQFASAALLSAWGLDFDLELELSQVDGAPSEGYLEMTESLVQAAGLELKREKAHVIVPRASRVRAKHLTAEPDLSSAFAVAALAVASRGEARFSSFPNPSLQPDAVFAEILRAMGASVDGQLKVQGPDQLKPIRWNLRDCPDLFPVLSVLCALAPGRSVLHGAPHLAHKESSRIESTAVLLKGLGCKFERREDGIEIEGGSPVLGGEWDFNPNHDHRLAMAAAVAQVAGSGVKILHPEVVDKSFPEFWELLAKGLS